jgi:hypothetical protein
MLAPICSVRLGRSTGGSSSSIKTLPMSVSAIASSIVLATETVLAVTLASTAAGAPSDQEVIVQHS